MGYPRGRSIFQAIRNFRAKGSGWPTKGVDDLAELVVTTMQRRNQVVAGGVASEGTGLSASVIPLDLTALDCVLNGKIKAQLAAQNDADLLTTAGAVVKAIFADGADASAIVLNNNGTACLTLIAHNSDGSGALVDTDNGVVKLGVIFAGTSATAESQTEHLTSQQIQDAIDAAPTVYAEGTSWVHLAQIDWVNPSNTPATTFTLNRNNHLNA